MAQDAQCTFVGMAHPWMCDTMGHVNVRHYMGIFDDASYQFLALIAGGQSSERLGWADVRCELDYRREITAGTALSVYTRLARIGGKSLTYVSRLTGSVDGALRAEAKTITVRFDLVARTAVDLEPALRQRATSLLVHDA